MGEEMQSKNLDRPWSVYAALLRPQISDNRIVEVVDANGNTVIPWNGFDSTGYSHAKQKKLAKMIVDAVNRS